MKRSKTYRRLGEKTLLIEWPDEINDAIVSDVLDFQTVLERVKIPGVKETWTAYRSIAVEFDPGTIEYGNLVRIVTGLASEKGSPTIPRIWRLPVCYETPHNSDLSSLAAQLALSDKEVIHLHSCRVYKVAFIGFLPGFLYLTGLDPGLHLPRKSTPSRTVAKGSVAIGGTQTGIYPSTSPGGWHIIGNCPISLFDPHNDPPCFIMPGDRIRFEPVDSETHSFISSQINSGEFDHHTLLENGQG